MRLQIRLHLAAGRSAPCSVTMPLAGMSGLEVSRGRHRRALLGTGLGLFAGASAGMLLGTTTADEDQGYAVPGLGLIGGAAGGLVGLLVGSRARERWKAVPLGAGNVRVGLAPSHGASSRVRIGMWRSF